MPWRKLYESCVCETNPDQLEKLVFKPEDAIALHYHDLALEPNGSDELRDIRRAAAQLLRLKSEKLGWSDPAKPTSSNEVKQPVALWINWRTLVSQIQAALLVAERAWQNWVFKSLK